MNAHVAWTAVESATTWLLGFPLGIVPSSLESQVRVVTRGTEIGLEVGSIIGTVPLLNGDTLNIVPKVGATNFFRMLLTAEGLEERLLNKEFDDFASWGVDDSPDAIPKLLARRFLLALAAIDAEGPRFGRTMQRQLRETASGKIVLRPTVRRLRLHAMSPFVCDRRVRDFNIPENRVLAAAAWTAAGLLSERANLEAWQSTIAFKWKRLFERKETLKEDLMETAEGLVKGEYGGPRGKYINALVLARLILGRAGMSQESRTMIMGDALLVNSATLFEDYVRAVLSKVYKPMGLTVSKGGAPIQFLYDDGSFGLIPDIRISRGLSTLVLGDAKYKIPDAGDHYQMATYMRSYGVRRAFLLCPDYEKEEREKIVRHRAADGRTVMEVRLPLRDLSLAEKILADLYQLLPFPSR